MTLARRPNSGDNGSVQTVVIAKINGAPQV